MVLYVKVGNKKDCKNKFYSQSFLILYFSFGFPSIANISPNVTAAAMPAEVAVIPPVNMPINPSLSTASITPFASEYPKPEIGTVAPVPAYLTIGSYMPIAVRTAPTHTYVTSILAGVSFVLSIKI